MDKLDDFSKKSKDMDILEKRIAIETKLLILKNKGNNKKGRYDLLKCINY